MCAFATNACGHTDGENNRILNGCFVTDYTEKQVPHMTSNGTNDNCRMYSFKAACYVPEDPTRVGVAFLFLAILSGACGTGEKKEFPGNRAGSWGTSANSHKNKCVTHHLHLTYHCTNSASSFLKRFSYLSAEAVLARRSRRTL